MEILKNKKVVAKILNGNDNNSYMFAGLKESRKCIACNVSIDKNINFDFLLKKKSYDLSYTFDGYAIVSKKFKEFCENEGMNNLRFDSLKNELNFYAFSTNSIVHLNHKLRQTAFEDYCEVCGRYHSVSGSTPNFLENKKQILEDTIYKSDVNYGFRENQGPLLICNIKIYKKMKTQNFKGVYFDDIYA